jgi:HK97 family phage major capsid protein
MKSARELQEAIAELRDELDSIIAVAEREERDLSEDETKRVTDITDTFIPGLNRQLKTATKIDQERNARSVKRANEEVDAVLAASGDVAAGAPAKQSRFGSIKIPAKAKVHGPLRAYKGENAERDAYIAGNVILAGIYGSESAQRFCQSYGLQVSATMTSSDNSKGGFIVPEEMSQTLIRLREERGVFPNFANRVPMGADIIRVPRLLSDVTAYWVGEGSEITASDPAIGAAELMARKIAALTKVSSELDEDAVIEVGDIITQSIAYALADKLDEAAFNGDGTSTYGGVLGLKNAIDSNATSTAESGNNAATNLDLLDFEKAVGMYPQYPGASPRWFMHSAFYWASAARLMDAAGGNWNGSLSSGPSTQMFLGYPVTFVQVLPSTTTTLASTIYGYFGDLRLGATYGTRRSMRTEVSTERYFENDLIGIKCTERVAIHIHERGDTIRNRPIIALKTNS